MESKIVTSQIPTQLTCSVILRLPPSEQPYGGSQTAAEGHWSTLALIVSIRILREWGKQVRFCKPQASKHKDKKLDLLIVEEANRSQCPICACVRVVVSWLADKHNMPPLSSLPLFNLCLISKLGDLTPAKKGQWPNQ